MIYSASEGCPSRAQFENQVRARTARARFIDEPGPGRFFRVYASVIDGHAAGGIISGASNSVSNMREVTSNDCDEVVSALALIVALALDSEASTTTSSSTPERSERWTTMPPVPLAAPYATQQPSPAVLPSPPAERTGSPKRSATNVVSLNVGGRVTGALWWSDGAISVGAWAVSLEGENTEPRILAPSVRISVEHAQSTVVDRAQGGAQFSITSGRLDACPIRFRLRGNVWVRPCVDLEAGRLSATGLGGGSVVDTVTRHRPWWAVGESIRVQFWLTRAWSSELQAGIAEPLWRDEFVFTRRSTGSVGEGIAKTPFFLPNLGIGTSVHFQ